MKCEYCDTEHDEGRGSIENLVDCRDVLKRRLAGVAATIEDLTVRLNRAATVAERVDGLVAKVKELERRLADVVSRARSAAEYCESLRQRHDQERQSNEHRTLVMGTAIKRAEVAEAESARLRETLEASVRLLKDNRPWETQNLLMRTIAAAPQSTPTTPTEPADERPTCETPGCGRPIPVGGEGCPETCPVCLAFERGADGRQAAIVTWMRGMGTDIRRVELLADEIERGDWRGATDGGRGESGGGTH